MTDSVEKLHRQNDITNIQNARGQKILEILTFLSVVCLDCKRVLLKCGTENAI
jgi:hypothetical protein